MNFFEKHAQELDFIDNDASSTTSTSSSNSTASIKSDKCLRMKANPTATTAVGGRPTAVEPEFDNVNGSTDGAPDSPTSSSNSTTTFRLASDLSQMSVDDVSPPLGYPLQFDRVAQNVDKLISVMNVPGPADDRVRNMPHAARVFTNLLPSLETSGGTWIVHSGPSGNMGSISVNNADSDTPSEKCNVRPGTQRQSHDRTRSKHHARRDHTVAKVYPASSVTDYRGEQDIHSLVEFITGKPASATGTAAKKKQKKRRRDRTLTHDSTVAVDEQVVSAERRSATPVGRGDVTLLARKYEVEQDVEDDDSGEFVPVLVHRRFRRKASTPVQSAKVITVQPQQSPIAYHEQCCVDTSGVAADSSDSGITSASVASGGSSVGALTRPLSPSPPPPLTISGGIIVDSARGHSQNDAAPPTPVFGGRPRTLPSSTPRKYVDNGGIVEIDSSDSVVSGGSSFVSEDAPRSRPKSPSPPSPTSMDDFPPLGRAPNLDNTDSIASSLVVRRMTVDDERELRHFVHSLWTDFWARRLAADGEGSTRKTDSPPPL